MVPQYDFLTEYTDNRGCPVYQPVFSTPDYKTMAAYAAAVVRENWETRREKPFNVFLGIGGSFIIHWRVGWLETADFALKSLAFNSTDWGDKESAYIYAAVKNAVKQALTAENVRRN